MPFVIQWQGTFGPASTPRNEARDALNYALQLLGKGYSEVVIVDSAEGGHAYAPADFARFYFDSDRDSSQVRLLDASEDAHGRRR